MREIAHAQRGLESRFPLKRRSSPNGLLFLFDTMTRPKRPYSPLPGVGGVNIVCERFLTDARYREGHLRVVNALPERRVVGLHSPKIKAVAKQLSRNGGEVVIEDIGTVKD